jgi:hypothetical protein
MIFPMDLADCGRTHAGRAAVPGLGVAPVYGAASARLRLGGVGIGPEWGLGEDRQGMEYPGNHLVLMAKRRGEGIP